MSFNFPNSPINGQLYTPIPGGFVYVFDAGAWKIVSDSGEDLTDADTLDGLDGSYYLAWANFTGKPSTFPPTLPIAQSGVTNLTTDLAAKEATANKGAVNGYASLDSSAKVPAAQLPSYVDDVLEYANLAAFPATGTTGIIYIALDTNKTYRWGGSSYVEISPSPGSSDSVPEGSVNLYYTTARAALKLDVSAYTAADVKTKLLTVDGTGSGVDADLLDGQDGAYYRARANHTGTQTLSTISDAGTAAAIDIHVGTTAPSSPSVNDIWVDTN